MRLTAILGWIVVSCAACGRVGYESRYGHELLVSVTLDRMALPAGATSPDELEPGASGLSFREALVIAANSPGADVIDFDPSMFSDGAPGVIELTSPLPPVSDAGTVIDVPRGSVIIDATNAGGGPILLVSGDFSRIEGLTIRNAPADGFEVTGEYVELWSNDVLDAGGRAVFMHDCVGTYFKYGQIERAGDTLLHVERCNDVHINWNTFVVGDKGALRGVYLLETNDSLVHDNLLDPGPARMVDLYASSRNEISNNVCDGAHACVAIEGDSHENRVLFNAAMAMLHDGFFIGAAATDNTVVHNTALECTNGFVFEAAVVEGNNLTSQSRADFVDPAAYDFHLAPGSAAIDAGEDLGYDLVVDDAERTFLGAAPDLGAIETQ
jgi:hypothetical protein